MDGNDLSDTAVFHEDRIADEVGQFPTHTPSWSCPPCRVTGVQDLLKPDTIASSPNGQARTSVRCPFRPTPRCPGHDRVETVGATDHYAFLQIGMKA